MWIDLKLGQFILICLICFYHLSNASHDNENNSTDVLVVSDAEVDINFFDINTNETFARKPVRERRGPCTCNGLKCSCCAGIGFQQTPFKRRFCTNLTYDPKQSVVNMNVMMNDNVLHEETMTGRNPPPVCIPLFIPTSQICLKFFNIFTIGRNIHICLDMEGNFQQRPIFLLHFDCMRMGQNGVAWLKPEEMGGQIDTESPGAGIGSGGGGGGGGGGLGGIFGGNRPPRPPTQPPGEIDQTDYDVYDVITEIKLTP